MLMAVTSGVMAMLSTILRAFGVFPVNLFSGHHRVKFFLPVINDLIRA